MLKSNETTNTALIIGPGGLRGAYEAGVAVKLLQELGNDWVDSVYASSVGVYMAAFFAAGQPKPIEHVWRKQVHGDQLVDWKKLLQGRSWLDLEYLADILQQNNEPSWLDVGSAISSSVDMTFTLTDYQKGVAEYNSPTEDNIFTVMTASCAVPFMHPPVSIGRREFVDGGIADCLPVHKALKDGHDQVVVITDALVGQKPDRYTLWSLNFLFREPVAEKLRTYAKRKQRKLETIKNDDRVAAIRPTEPLPMRSFMDTKKENINKTFDRGMIDTKEMLPEIKNLLHNKHHATTRR